MKLPRGSWLFAIFAGVGLGLVAAAPDGPPRNSPIGEKSAGPRAFPVAVVPAGIDGPARNAILSVHDGDTASFLVRTADLGDGHATYASFPARVAGLYAAELREPDGPAARQALVKILNDAPAGSLEIEPTGDWSFGRVVCRVYRVDKDGGRHDIAVLMRAAGFDGRGEGAKGAGR